MVKDTNHKLLGIIILGVLAIASTVTIAGLGYAWTWGHSPGVVLGVEAYVANDGSYYNATADIYDSGGSDGISYVRLNALVTISFNDHDRYIVVVKPYEYQHSHVTIQNSYDPGSIKRVQIDMVGFTYNENEEGVLGCYATPSGPIPTP